MSTETNPAEPGSLRNAGPWEHLDGTPCPYYVASRPRPSADEYWWCTEHQQHVRPAEPNAGDVEALAEAICAAICEGERPVGIPESDNPRHRVAACYEHQRAAESPALRDLLASERAKALLAAADEMDDTDDPDAIYIDNGDIDLWLRARAARIARAEADQ